MIYKCEYCNETIEYFYIELFGKEKFCSDDCSDDFIEEHKLKVDI